MEKIERGPYRYSVIKATGDKSFIVDGTNWIEVPTNALPDEIQKIYEERTKPRQITASNLPNRQWEVQSSTNPDSVYVVRLWQNSAWTCDCVGFNFRRSCKHIDKCKTLVKG